MKTSLKWIRDGVAVVVGSALVGIGFNLFLIPHQLLSGGISGISMLIGYLTDWDIGTLYFILNLPLFIWGWIILGKRFVLLSFVSVVTTVIVMELLAAQQFNYDPLIASVFGGVIVGIGTGLSFRAGGSTGGFDIVGSIVTRRYDFPLGVFLFALNGIVVVMLGLSKNNWDLALYSMLSIFVGGKVIDTVYVRHVKITAFIVTAHKEAMLAKLRTFPRGVTVIRTQGAYSSSENYMLMTVTTRYELQELKKIIRDVDSKAFVNIVETLGVMGMFRREQ